MTYEPTRFGDSRRVRHRTGDHARSRRREVFVCDIDAKALECFKAEILPLLHFEQSKKRLAARDDCARPWSVIYTLDHPLDSNLAERRGGERRLPRRRRCAPARL